VAGVMMAEVVIGTAISWVHCVRQMNSPFSPPLQENLSSLWSICWVTYYLF